MIANFYNAIISLFFYLSIVFLKKIKDFWENNKSEILKQLLQRKRVVNETNEIKCDFRYRSVSTGIQIFYKR